MVRLGGSGVAIRWHVQCEDCRALVPKDMARGHVLKTGAEGRDLEYQIWFCHDDGCVTNWVLKHEIPRESILKDEPVQLPLEMN